MKGFKHCRVFRKDHSDSSDFRGNQTITVVKGDTAFLGEGGSSGDGKRYQKFEIPRWMIFVIPFQVNNGEGIIKVRCLYFRLSQSFGCIYI